MDVGQRLKAHAQEKSNVNLRNVRLKIGFPTLRNPEDLYLDYSGRLEELSTASREAALQDLRSLLVPPGLPQQAFTTYIGTLLLQKPIIRRVDLLLESPQRFGAVTDLLSALPCSFVEDFNADRAWQTLMRWLRHFLPNRYTLSVPGHSEIFFRTKSLPEKHGPDEITPYLS